MARNTPTRSASEKRRAARRARAGRRGGPRRFLAALLLAVLVGGGYYLLGTSSVDVGDMARRVMDRVDSKGSEQVVLYFADPQWTKLVGHTATIPAGGDKAERIATLVSMLAEGPASGEGAVLPPEAKLRKVYLGPGGRAVIDFEPNLGALRSYGAGAEMLAVFAIVHTITDNVEGVQSVQILVGGDERETLGGHVSISEPLGPRPDLVEIEKGPASGQ